MSYPVNSQAIKFGGRACTKPILERKSECCVDIHQENIAISLITLSDTKLGGLKQTDNTQSQQTV